VVSHVVVDQIKPEAILQKIGSYQMAFAESYKGEGGPSDANFQQFNGSWRRQTITEAQEVWLENFKRNAVIAGTRAGFNFCEFWGWPEVQCRDDGTCRVAARIRILKVKIEHKPRVLNG
jgi:hypothetical protein